MAFSLAEMLKEVSNPDTGREQIEYIRLDLIDSDANNFYQLSDIEGLADNISFAGLQQPIRVRKNADNDRYTIISGHRRRAAIELLAKDEPEKWQEVSCIVQQDTASPALQQLQLIFANSSTRKLTSAEISEQAVQVEKLLYKLKEEEGYEFPGRMRDHVSEVVGVSKTKIARLKVIRDDLAPRWYDRFATNSLNESTAYALARIPYGHQIIIYEALEKANRLPYIYESDIAKYEKRFDEIEHMTCSENCGMPCINAAGKMMAAVNAPTYSYCHCHRCCSICPDLVRCKFSCPNLADKVKQMKEDARCAKRQEKAAQEERERPKIQKIQDLWCRFGYLREQSGKSVQEVFEATKMYYGKSDDKKYKDLEDGVSKISVATTLPYGYNASLSDVDRLVAVADLFGCSLDYLLCRTDDPDPKAAENVSNLNTGWRTGNPKSYGTYVAYVFVDGAAKPIIRELLWDGECWYLHGDQIHDDVTVQCWAERPEF